jgi:hypothetical protein
VEHTTEDGATPTRANAGPSRAAAHQSAPEKQNAQVAQLQFLLDSAAITPGEFRAQKAALDAVQPGGTPLHAGAAAAGHETMSRATQATAVKEAVHGGSSARAATDGIAVAFATARREATETATWEGDATYTHAVNAMEAAARAGSRSPPQWYEALRDEGAVSKSSARIASEVDAATDAVAGLLRSLRAKCDAPLEVCDMPAPSHRPRPTAGAPNTPGQRVTVDRVPSRLRHDNDLLLNHMEAPLRDEREYRLHSIGYVPDPWLPPDEYRAERDERRARLHRLRLRHDGLIAELAAGRAGAAPDTAESTLRAVGEGGAAVALAPRGAAGARLRSGGGQAAGRRGATAGEEGPSRLRSAADEMPALQPSRVSSSALRAELNALDAVLVGASLAGAAPGSAEGDAGASSGAVLDTGAWIAADQWHAVARLEEPAPSPAVAAHLAARETQYGRSADLATCAAEDAELERWISAEVHRVERSGFGGGAATEEGFEFKLNDDDCDSGGLAAELREEIAHIHRASREEAAAAEALYRREQALQSYE